MKKILMLMVSAALVLGGVFTSCEKDDDDSKTPENGSEVTPDDGEENTGEEDKTDDGGSTTPEDTTPTISWDANPDFSPYNISGSDLDVEIVVDAPKGIETFTLLINTDNTILNLVLSAVVPVNSSIDLINGETAETLMALGINCGLELYGATNVVFDVTDLVSLMPALAGDAAFTATLNLAVTDSEGQTVEKTLSLYAEEPTPIISWDANPDFESYNLGGSDLDVKVSVHVPKGIETFTLLINTDNTILNLVLSAVVPVNSSIDLINGETAETLMALGINCGPELYGATDVTFDVTDLVGIMPQLVSTSFTATLVLKVADPEGHSTEQEMTFYLE